MSYDTYKTAIISIGLKQKKSLGELLHSLVYLSNVNCINYIYYELELFTNTKLDFSSFFSKHIPGFQQFIAFSSWFISLSLLSFSPCYFCSISNSISTSTLLCFHDLMDSTGQNTSELPVYFTSAF